MATKNDDQIEKTSSEGDGPEPSADAKSNTTGEEQENLSKDQEGKTEIVGAKASTQPAMAIGRSMAVVLIFDQVLAGCAKQVRSSGDCI